MLARARNAEYLGTVYATQGKTAKAIKSFRLALSIMDKSDHDHGDEGSSTGGDGGGSPSKGGGKQRVANDSWKTRHARVLCEIASLAAAMGARDSDDLDRQALDECRALIKATPTRSLAAEFVRIGDRRQDELAIQCFEAALQCLEIVNRSGCLGDCVKVCVSCLVVSILVVTRAKHNESPPRLTRAGADQQRRGG